MHDRDAAVDGQPGPCHEDDGHGGDAQRQRTQCRRQDLQRTQEAERVVDPFGVISTWAPAATGGGSWRDLGASGCRVTAIGGQPSVPASTPSQGREEVANLCIVQHGCAGDARVAGDDVEAAVELLGQAPTPRSGAKGNSTGEIADQSPDANGPDMRSTSNRRHRQRRRDRP